MYVHICAAGLFTYFAFAFDRYCVCLLLFYLCIFSIVCEKFNGKFVEREMNYWLKEILIGSLHICKVYANRRNYMLCRFFVLISVPFFVHLIFILYFAQRARVVSHHYGKIDIAKRKICSGYWMILLLLLTLGIANNIVLLIFSNLYLFFRRFGNENNCKWNFGRTHPIWKRNDNVKKWLQFCLVFNTIIII